jgi:hypothetical protein
MNNMKKRSLLLNLVSVLTIQLFAQMPTDGLIFHFSFSGDMTDDSGNGYSGVVEGATLTTDRFDNANSAYLFDGVDDYIRLHGEFDTTSVKHPATVSFWVKAEKDSAQAIFGIIDTIDTYNPITGIYVGNSITGSLTDELITVARNVNDSDKYIVGVETDDRSQLFDDNWHHIVVVYNDTLTKIYRDDTLVTTKNNWGLDNGHFGVPGESNVVSLGARMHNNMFGGFFKGSLDEFRLYNKALDSTEVSALYNETPTSNITVNSKESFLKVYPNLTSDLLTLNLMSNLRDCSVRIINLNGQMLYNETISQDKIQISLRSITYSGICLLQLCDSTGNIIEVKKIILR